MLVAAVAVDRGQLLRALNFPRGNLRRLLVVFLLAVAFFTPTDFLQSLDERFLDERLALRGKTLSRFRILGAIEVFPAIGPGLLDARVI